MLLTSINCRVPSFRDIYDTTLSFGEKGYNGQHVRYLYMPQLRIVPEPSLLKTLHKLLIYMKPGTLSWAFVEYFLAYPASTNISYADPCVSLSFLSGDSLGNHNGMQFTTWDSDNDNWDSGNCARDKAFGGWWYNKCYQSNLNGIYHQSNDTDGKKTGIFWKEWKGDFYSLKRTEMKIRRI